MVPSSLPPPPPPHRHERPNKIIDFTQWHGLKVAKIFWQQMLLKRTPRGRQTFDGRPSGTKEKGNRKKSLPAFFFEGG
jgi:hypothetical protein